MATEQNTAGGYTRRATGAVLKDKKVKLWREMPGGKDEDGFPITEPPVCLGTFWANYRHVSAQEYYAAASTQYSEDAIFILNYNSVTANINVMTDYLVYRGCNYYINQVDDYQGGKNDIKIRATVHRNRG